MARKILLADDSVTAQNMGRKILSDAGYDVVTVNNGSAALKRVTEQKPDLIVLDVYMPGYSGLEVCQRLKDSPDTEAIPILLTVGKLEPFKPEEARRVRAEAYIVKPFEASELLSALTRLEDQIVPGHGRNGKSEGHGDSETGWKNRLRFPAKKKKEEPEPESPIEFVAKAGLRDARGDKTTSTAAPIPDIPRDITPEELDALSALAAKLDGESSQNTAPEETFSSQTEVAPAVEVPHVAADTNPAAEIAPAEPLPAATDAKPFEVVPVPAETLAEKEPAPVDKKDEPLFATPVVTKEPAVAEKLSEQSAVAEHSPSAPEAQAKAEDTKAVESAEVEKATVNAASAEAPKLETEAAATAAAGPAQEVESSTPSEQELAEALRLLTPSAADSSTMPSQETLAAAGAALAQEAARSASTATHWTAVAVAIDPEEAARSLEAEMFQSLARSAESSSTPSGPAGNESPAASSVEVRQESTGNIEDRAAADEPAGVTFADAVLQNDEPARSVETAASAAAVDLPQAVGTTNSAAAGGGEAMGNEHGKNGKSNWHQIRAAAPPAKDAVEAAKQADAEEPPKAMAAAADGARPAPTDPTAIANIVDSVLADLRPKIVEEISKKLAGK